MNIQPVFNEYNTVHICVNISQKTEDQCSKAMKEAAKEAFENNMHHYETMKTIAKSYFNNRECFCTRGSLPYFARINAKENLTEDRVQVLPSENELNELAGDSPNIFRKSNISPCVKRPSSTFCNG